MRKSRCVRRLLAAALPLFAVPFFDANAQSLDDPMRPSGTAPAVEGLGGSATARAPTHLQGVLTSPTRRLALIDGAIVPLGSVIGGAKLAGVGDSHAVLHRERSQEVLLLHPGIEKKVRPRRDESP